jgi:alpha-ketoglutarate-dependent taurine dioxygenase
MDSTLKRDGYMLLQDLSPDISTAEIGSRFGVPVEIGELLPLSEIPVVQALRPKEKLHARQNQYSGHYGLESFPLHTDLAHWAVPPRYFLLRCLVGADDVFTRLLSWTYISDLLGKATLRKAVFRARHHYYWRSGLVRALSSYGVEEIFRWDPVFLEPLNKGAQALKEVMLDRTHLRSTIEIRLAKSGEAILIDNWRMLHGRSAVPARSTDRHIERIYLSEVFHGR